jgi:two-component system LytT family response regulator
MTVRCLIVEDEPLAVERLESYLRQLPALELMAVFDRAAPALSFLLTSEVDLLFLDVNLGGMSGLELLETAVVRCQVILTTAHPEHALKAYDLQVADYLLKPFTFARFVQAMDRARERQGKSSPAYLFVKTGLRLEKVLVADILYVEGEGDYRCIHTKSKQIMTLQTFTELAQRIPICRVHKSYAVAIDKIESVERDRIRIGEKLIPISESYRERFYSLIR